MLLRDEIAADLEIMEREMSVEADLSAQHFSLLVPGAGITADSTIVTADSTIITADSTVGGFTEVQIPCSVGNFGRSIVIDPQGNTIEVALRLIVRRKAFLQAGLLPVVLDANVYIDANDQRLRLDGFTPLFRGETYRIISVTAAATKSHFEIVLADPASSQ